MAQTVLAEPRRISARERVLAEVRGLGLEAHLVDLEAHGFTVLRGVLDTERLDRARAAIIARAERAAARNVDIEAETGEGFAGMRYIPFLLFDDPVFESILMEPKPLALVTWLLGESCLLSSMGSHFRSPGGMPLMLHSDNGNGIPAPFPAYALVANINYALTPYSKPAGALAMVPGSHRLARQPTAAENFTIGGLSGAQTAARLRAGPPPPDAAWVDPPGAVAMDLAPGDAVVWHGGTWHGSFRRELAGVRMNLAVYFCRQFIQTQEQRKGAVPPEVLARHADDPRFATLLGNRQPYGWRAEGPDYALMARNPRGLFD